MLFLLQTDCFDEEKKILNVSEEFEGYFQHLKNSTKKINQQNGHAGKVRIQRFWSKLISPQNMLFLLQPYCFDERTKFWMFQKNSKGIFNIWKTQPKKSTNKMATPVMSGYSDIRQNWKVRKTCCFCFKLIVLMKEQHFEFFRRIGRVFSTFPKINRKMATPVRSRYSDFGQNWKVRTNMLFLLHSDCFDERTKFWMFQKNSKGIFNIWKTQPKKSTNKMATPVRSGYSDIRQNWKVRKTCCFCFKLIVLMKEQHFEFFRRIGRVFTTFQKINQKNGHAS